MNCDIYITISVDEIFDCFFFNATKRHVIYLFLFFHALLSERLFGVAF